MLTFGFSAQNISFFLQKRSKFVKFWVFLVKILTSARNISVSSTKKVSKCGLQGQKRIVLTLNLDTSSPVTGAINRRY